MSVMNLAPTERVPPGLIELLRKKGFDPEAAGQRRRIQARAASRFP